MVPIRIIYDSKLPFNLHNGTMHPLKPCEPPEVDLNGDMDPLVSIKLSNKKTGLIFPNSATPVDVTLSPVKRVDSIIIHIHGGGFVT